jgi:hypothetical protein
MPVVSARSDLDVYDIAFLAGGPVRVIETALVVLVESGRVQIHAPGELATADPTRRHPVEGAVLDAVGDKGHRSVDTIHWRLEGDERLTGLAGPLTAAGLLRRRLRPGHAAWTPTHAGQRTLVGLAAHPPADRALDGGSALAVALHGRGGMADRRLCSEIFERSVTTLGPPGHRRSHDIDHSDPRLAAYRTGGAAAAAGAFLKRNGSGV